MKRIIKADSGFVSAREKREILKVKEAMHALETAMYAVHRETLEEYDLIPLFDELQDSMMHVGMHLETKGVEVR